MERDDIFDVWAIEVPCLPLERAAISADRRRQEADRAAFIFDHHRIVGIGDDVAHIGHVGRREKADRINAAALSDAHVLSVAVRVEALHLLKARRACFEQTVGALVPCVLQVLGDRSHPILNEGPDHLAKMRAILLAHRVRSACDGELRKGEGHACAS